MSHSLRNDMHIMGGRNDVTALAVNAFFWNVTQHLQGYIFFSEIPLKASAISTSLPASGAQTILLSKLLTVGIS